MKKRRIIWQLLDQTGLSEDDFNRAYAATVALFQEAGIQVEDSERIRLCVLLSYRPQGKICDLGSYINMYPVCLSILGMSVTTIDYYPQASEASPFYNEEIHSALDVFRSIGIDVRCSDLYDVDLGRESFDIVSSFETFEHLWHSPKPLMNKISAGLVPRGEFVLSVPNIARLSNRVKSLIGRSPLPSYDFFYDYGFPFTGHRREMTVAEVEWMQSRAGFEVKNLFTASLMPPLAESATLLGRLARTAENSLPALPSRWKSQIFCTAGKPR